MIMVQFLGRVLIPLLAVLALLAWGATSLLNTTARSWFERDATTRVHIAMSSARDTLATCLAAGDRRRLSSVLEEIGRGDSIVGAMACSTSGATLARTRGFPVSLGCEPAGGEAASAGASPSSGDVDFSSVLDGRPVRVSVVSIRDADDELGRVMVVHDMSYAAHRQSAMGRMTAAVFAVVAVLASLLTILLQRMSWRSWTRELRRLLIMGRAPRSASSSRCSRTSAGWPPTSPPRNRARAADRGRRSACTGPSSAHYAARAWWWSRTGSRTCTSGRPAGA